MDPTAREELEQTIRAELADLEREIERLGEEVAPIAPDRAIGRLTRMEAINAQKMSQANLRRARQRKSALERARERLDDEDFGTCTRCERAIPLGRLMLVPESGICIRCAERR